LAAKSVLLLSKLLMANQRLSKQERRAETGGFAGDLQSGYLQSLKAQDLIQEVSSVSVCNVFAGQEERLVSSFLQLSTAFVSNQNLAGFALVSLIVPGQFSACHKARDVAQCCALNGNNAASSSGCCVDAACGGDKWANPLWIDQWASPHPTLIMPNNPAGRDAFAYEVQVAQSRGNGFDSTELASASTVLVAVRKQDSTRMLPDGKLGDPMQAESQQRILRMPMSVEVHDRMLRDSVNTVSKAGRIPACVVWNEDVKEWTITGMSQLPGFRPIHKMCTSNATGASQCFYYLECFTTLSQGTFALVQAPMDCAGGVLGDGLWDMCDVCKGDNSTCSGCDNLPNVVYDGLSMTKGCSGHGQCQGLMCR
jgi:hypothetical protein